jgi:hypothetical protein
MEVIIEDTDVWWAETTTGTIKFSISVHGQV